MLPPIYFDITKSIDGLGNKIDHLKTPPIDVNNAQEIKVILQRHGCTLEEHPDYCVLKFPEGTKRRRGMTLGVSECYKIELPDGFLLSEAYDIPRELSFLSIPAGGVA